MSSSYQCASYYSHLYTNTFIHAYAYLHRHAFTHMQKCTCPLTLSYIVSLSHTWRHTHTPLTLSFTVLYTFTVLTHSYSLSLGTCLLSHTHTQTHALVLHSLTCMLHMYIFLNIHTAFIYSLCSVSKVPTKSGYWISSSTSGFAYNPSSFLTHLEKSPIPNPLLQRRAGRLINCLYVGQPLPALGKCPHFLQDRGCIYPLALAGINDTTPFCPGLQVYSPRTAAILSELLWQYGIGGNLLNNPLISPVTFKGLLPTSYPSTRMLSWFLIDEHV